MAQKRKAADDEGDRLQKTLSKYRKRSRPSKGASGNETEQHTRQIVAQAYQEAARIIDEAKAQVKHITSQAGEWGITADRRLSDLVKSGILTKHSYEQIDDLFVHIRHCLADIA
jgi:cell division septum initiation protein DivIVA